MRAAAEKPHDAVVKFDAYRNVQRHRAVLPATAQLLYQFLLETFLALNGLCAVNKLLTQSLFSDTYVAVFVSAAVFNRH